MQTIRWQLVTASRYPGISLPGELCRRTAGLQDCRLQERLGCAQGPETGGTLGGRFVCQSSCKTQQGCRNPRVVVEEAAAQAVARSR